MPIEKKVISAFINQDDEPHSLASEEALLACNMRYGSSVTGLEGRWENVPANTAIPTTYIDSVKDTSLHAISDEAGRYIVNFVHNSDNLHKIILYYKPTGTFWKVLVDSKLNFSKDSLIKAAINPDKHILYWTDNRSEPCRLNLMAAIKMNHAGVSPIDCDWQYTSIADAYDYTLIRRPPCLTGTIQKETDESFTSNFIANQSFQFAYQYIYYDGEQSVLSAYTASSRLNTIEDTKNRIKVTLSTGEVIPESVRFVRLAVIYENKGFFIRTWDREKAADRTELQGHNQWSGLTYHFYNDLTGEPIDAATITTPFHSVPILSGTLELAKNRLFLGDNVEGYDSPATTSLEASVSTMDVQSMDASKQVISIRHRRDGHSGDSVVNGYSYAGWYVQITEKLPNGYYVIKGTEKKQITASDAPGYPTLDPPPTTVGFDGLEFKGATLNDVINKTIPPEAGLAAIDINSEEVHTFHYLTVTGLNILTLNVFKSGSKYRLGTVFYDRAMRKCGVVSKENVFAFVPRRDFNHTVAVTGIDWKLSNVAAATEIPDWAYYYSVVMTRNLRTRFFMQFSDNAIYYAGKGEDSEKWVSAGTNFTTGGAVKTTAIAISLKALIQAGLGYSYNEGDVCMITSEAGDIHELPVLDVQGDLLLLSAKDIGTTLNKKFIVEIYTPYKPSEQEGFYEMGEIYKVTNAGTPGRAYSKLNGKFVPDSHAVTRNYLTYTYLAETMSPNDKFWKRWEGDYGRINIITDGGQRHKKTNISFSNTYVPGTQTNGLSAFEALNEENLPAEMGTIRALVLTSKVQSEGTVLLAIGENQTASIYLGEAQITDSTGATAYFAKSVGVIGQVNVLRGDYGTLNPESVVQYKGGVYWLDVNSGRFVQYSVNGLDPISHYKLRRFTAQFCKKLLSTSKATIEGFGSRPFVFGGIDPLHEEVLWTLPKLAETPHAPLSDFDPAIAYPYDIADFKGKTIAYKVGADKWLGEFNYEAEGFVSLDTDMYAFKNGVLYRHNAEGVYNTFFGVPVKSRLMIVSNAEPSKVKIFDTVSVEGSSQPSWTHFRTEHPYEQSSDLVSDDYVSKEGVYYASILRDRLTPGANSAVEGLYTGDEMRGSVLKVLLEWADTDKLIYVRAINIGFSYSTGHKV
jgi:hypothetical protein